MTPTRAELGVEQRVRYGDEVIVFRTRVQSGRHRHKVAIHVEPDGCVWVETPESATSVDVLAAVRKHVAWVSRQIAAARKRRTHVLPREFVSGESVLYLGRRYRLKVVVEALCVPAAALQGGFLVVRVPQHLPEIVRGAVTEWYLARARNVLAKRLAAVASSLRWVRTMPPMRFRLMTVQWGSCSPAGRLTMNPLLVKAPTECIDYVLMHELVHLLHHNHSPAFYRTLVRHIPNWRIVKTKLDGMADEIFR